MNYRMSDAAPLYALIIVVAAVFLVFVAVYLIVKGMWTVVAVPLAVLTIAALAARWLNRDGKKHDDDEWWRAIK